MLFETIRPADMADGFIWDTTTDAYAMATIERLPSTLDAVRYRKRASPSGETLLGNPGTGYEYVCTTCCTAEPFRTFCFNMSSRSGSHPSQNHYPTEGERSAIFGPARLSKLAHGYRRKNGPRKGFPGASARRQYTRLI